jgi:pimeloyl-ACP methyl ester carboxylesterase
MPTTIIDGIATRYEVIGSGPPILIYAPGGFDATVEKWSALGVYAKIKLLEHLPNAYTCILFDRRECGQSGGRVERVTWGDYVAQGKGLLDHLGIARAHIMGSCMGCSGLRGGATRRDAKQRKARVAHAMKNEPVAGTPSWSTSLAACLDAIFTGTICSPTGLYQISWSPRLRRTNMRPTAKSCSLAPCRTLTPPHQSARA